MKNRRIYPSLLLAAASMLSTSANATLMSRLGGLAIYDTDLNITWLSEASSSLRDWSSAKNWAAALSVGGFTDWRLPTTLINDATCSFWGAGQPVGYGCTGSELGHLFYNELGGVAGQSLNAVNNGSYNLFQGFPNLGDINIWSSTPSNLGVYSDSNAYYFTFNVGGQYDIAKWHDMTAMAVRTGDVVAAVPEPSAIWLLSAGLMCLAWASRKRKSV